MYIYLFAGIYMIHLMYSYVLPYYWLGNISVKNEELVRLRIKDAVASTVNEELWGN